MVYWITFRDELGRKKHKRIGPSRKSAVNESAKIATEVTESRFIDRKERKTSIIRDFIGKDGEKGYRDYCKDNHRSYPKLQRILLDRIVATWGSKYLHELTDEDLDKYRPLVPKTLWNRLLTRLRHMYGRAKEYGYVDEIPFNLKGRKNKDAERKRLRYLSEGEWERLKAELAPHLLPIVTTALCTGMRIGEILSMRLGVELDLERRFIQLEKTKTDEPREIPINETLNKTLTAVTQKMQIGDLLFPQAEIKRGFGGALRRAGILDFRIHDLRHTFASWMVQRGVDLYTVSHLLGHKSIEQTMRYAHLGPDHPSRAVAVIDAVLAATGSEPSEVPA